MFRRIAFVGVAFLLAAHLACAQSSSKQLAREILANRDFNIVLAKAKALLKSDFNAGGSYPQLWVRDFNTFINGSLQVGDRKQVREALLKFFYFQGFDGNMVDGYQRIGPHAKVDAYAEFARYDMPGYAFFKNTVETDQESSLIQAVYKYFTVTGDTSILNETVHGKTVLARMEMALNYLMNFRFNKKYGLLWGGATADWGDVQFEDMCGVRLDENSDPAISIYTNAMFLIALHDFIAMCHDSRKAHKWQNIYDAVRQNVLNYLWDSKHKKFIPHIYIKSSPFKNKINENQIFYHGGTVVAIEAGLLTRQDVLISLHKMEQDVREAHALSIGLTLYPPYPAGSFMNPVMAPYSYQNGGDWTWFGARMITQLVRYGYVKEAYREIQPFVNRVIKNNGFYEWYTVQGKPRGSNAFRGSAGVLMQAIEALQERVKTPAKIGFTAVRATDERTVDFKESGWPGVISGTQGLYPPESWGTWSSGGVVTFEFCSPLPKKFAVHLVAYAFGPNAGKDFVARVGDCTVRFALAASLNERVLEFNNPTGSKIIKIDVPSPCSPKELGLSNDARKLGIGFSELRIEPH